MKIQRHNSIKSKWHERPDSFAIMLICIILILTVVSWAEDKTETDAQPVEQTQSVKVDQPEGLSKSVKEESEKLQKESMTYERDLEQNKDKLKHYINLIRTAKIDSEEITQRSGDLTNETPKPKIDTSKKTEEIIAPAAPTEAMENTEVPNTEISEEVHDKIGMLMDEPEKVDEPYMLAQILFDCEHWHEASVFYKETLRRIDADGLETADRDWVIFQLGNCLKKYNKEEAVETYKQLINDVPDSEWADIARTQVKLLSWYIDNNVAGLTSTTIEMGKTSERDNSSN